MSSTNANARRRYGTGSIISKDGVYHGKWRVGERQVWRKLGPIRTPGTREGLTRTQAEAKLRTLMTETLAPAVVERVTVEDAGQRLIAHLDALGRKRATIESYESILRVHLAPFFGQRSLSSIASDDVERFMTACRASGHAPKSTLNYLGVLHGIFDYALRRKWVMLNPCKLVDKPRAMDTDPDVRFLDADELAALLAEVHDDDLGRVERVMYLTAAMTGMRQGELLALRWLDVDWMGQRIRVRRNFVRGEYGTPKSKRSSRSVPLADVLGGELDLLHRESAYKADDDLVFAHPHTGKPIDRSKLLKRFKATVKRAGVGQFEEVVKPSGDVELRPLTRFHDLRHTFGTRMAAAGVPMRTLQEWLGHRDFKTTLIYADYQPGENEAGLVNAAFAPSSTNASTNTRPSQTNPNAVGQGGPGAAG
jgi:integrase